MLVQAKVIPFHILFLPSSFGQSAIFLIGGKSKQVKPTPLLLRSGDVVIMSGEARLAHHGVPKIIPPTGNNLIPSSLSVDSLSQYFGGVSHCQSGHDAPTSNTNAFVAIEGEHGCKERKKAKEEKKLSTSTGKTKPSRGYCCNHDEVLSSWPEFISYLSSSRINVNVRQVVSDLCRF